MKLGTEDKKKLTLLAIAGTGALAAAFYMYTQLSTPDLPPAAAPVVVTTPTTAKTKLNGTAGKQTSGNAAGKLGSTSAAYDPTLKMQAMLVTESLVYTGAGRNIFSPNSAPVSSGVAIPKPIAPARPVGVVLPVYQAPTGPPPPPPIDLKFFGTAKRGNGALQAFLLHGDDVFLASPGDIVQRRYKIGAITANSIQVEDLTNQNTQSLPLEKN